MKQKNAIYLAYHRDKARHFIDQGNQKLALQELNLVLAMDDQDGNAWFQKGISLCYLDELIESSNAFYKAAQLEFRSDLAFLNAAIVLSKAGKNEDALIAFKKAKEINTAFRSYGEKVGEIGFLRNSFPFDTH